MDSQARLVTLLNTAVDGIVIIDAAGLVQVFNRAAEGIFGYRADEVVGRNVSMLMPPPDRERHDGYIAAYTQTRKAKIIGIGREVVARHKDGRLFPMDLAVGEGREGGERFFVATVRDITERRRRSKELQETRAELLHMSRLSEMGQMASALAHELNQPLTAVMNYAQAARRLLRDAVLPQADKVRDMLEKTVGQASRAGQIIRRLRDFVEKGATDRASEEINAVVEEAGGLALVGAASDGVEVRFDLAPALPMIVIDKVQIQQVVVNLVRNAIEAMAGQKRRALTIATLGNVSGIVVAITDTGPGLAPEILARLFQPFVTTKSKGMGIGLSVCRTIVEAHGGRLWAETNPAGGTIFRFALPLPSGAERADD